jgi:hypothetical protein
MKESGRTAKLMAIITIEGRHRDITVTTELLQLMTENLLLRCKYLEP